MPKIAIIIINWNGIKNTLECLTSLQKITYPNYQVIVVDNGSTEEGVKLLRQLQDNSPASKIQVIFNQTNLGFAQANNIGIRQAFKDPEIKYICTLNNDTVVDSNFLTKAVARIENDQVEMIAMKMMKYREPKEVDSFGVALTQSGLAFNIKNYKQYAISNKLFCPCAGAALYSRELLEKVGLFDPDFFCYAEDLDLGFRARLLGFKCALADKAIIYHKGSASTEIMSPTAVYYTYRNIIWVLVKNLPGLLVIKYLPKIIIGQLAIIFLWFCRRKPGLILKAYLDGLTGISKMLKKRKKTKRTISLKELESHITPGIFLKDYLKNLKI